MITKNMRINGTDAYMLKEICGGSLDNVNFSALINKVVREVASIVEEKAVSWKIVDSTNIISQGGSVSTPESVSITLDEDDVTTIMKSIKTELKLTKPHFSYIIRLSMKLSIMVSRGFDIGGNKYDEVEIISIDAAVAMEKFITLLRSHKSEDKEKVVRIMRYIDLGGEKYDL